MTGPSKAMKAAFPPKRMSLIESVESIVVSALARQDEWGEWQYGHGGGEKGEPTEPDSSVVTRDIILAVADVLDTNGEDYRTHAGPHVHSTSSDWLRSQASAGTQATEGD